MSTLPSPQGSYYTSPLKAVHYGRSSLLSLPSSLQSLNASRVFLLTGNSISKTALCERVKQLIGDKLVGVNNGIGQHAPIAGIRKAMADVTAANADTLVALGGGSPIDAAKAIKYFLHTSSPSSSPSVWLNILIIPTTLSNADTTQNAGYTDDQGQKVSVSAVELCPQVIIYDAEATLDTPQRLWLSSGMRSVDHAIETLYRRGMPPPVLATALQALPMLFTHLLASHQHPEDLGTREQLQLACWLSLYPNPLPGAVGLSHGLGHALGATYAIPHGITSCLTLAASCARVARRTKPEYQALLSEALRRVEGSVPDLPPPTSRFSKPGDSVLPQGAQDGVKLAGYVDALVHTLGLGSTLREYGIGKEEFESICMHGHGDENPDVGREEVLEILEEIW
ncbi:Dehydroquinate synthase-like protein [Dacryopinax primogenitus]|uniref:Dehydroquinate synthase-like protein n=1 Tax=Dacryopinax primogenitus (strain DJM 731) TaxID=1858805 RepID=M5GE52_DACPD|nr:Dehydroquinate synthase-like protein [Dacryopinax primogenitus]EJU05087.1 Dehydroquinate synthase-like protein [Dacryopinax primogenitus]